jgi:2-polyprenyl-6-hydroxyphenyl methylase / 3-demethylubiquinone-9 3-methyltransferase
MSTAAVNNAIYEDYGERWYTAYDDPVALLRAQALTTAPWAIERIAGLNPGQPAKTRVLDVACGAGFISNALAAHGFTVSAVDLSLSSLDVARRHDATGRVDYVHADAYQLPYADGQFDAVTSMDFLEHVEEPERSIAECARVLRPGGLFIFHTFNRNRLAGLVVIRFVEWFVRNTPKHLHVLRLFIRPEELREYCQRSGMIVCEFAGIRPAWKTLSVAAVLRRTVPAGLRFQLTRSLALSYIGAARKADERLAPS